LLQEGYSVSREGTARVSERGHRSASALTYSDVHMVLALLQGWDEGAVSLRYHDLAVDAVLKSVEPSRSPDRAAAPSRVQIRSPAVGTFTPRVGEGAVLKSNEAIGVIDAPGRSTPVISPTGGKLVQLTARIDGFVEYDQEIATIEPIASE
jgi:biotin carboxyl carrier protein